MEENNDLIRNQQNESANTIAQNGSVIQHPLHQSLQDLIGLHRQLLDVVRQENEAVLNADSKTLFEVTASKEALLHWIMQSENQRQLVVQRLSDQLSLDSKTTLKQMILHFQSVNPVLSSQLQTDLNALVVLVERIQLQNSQNAKLIAKSLEHVDAMRKNIFGEAQVESKTYNKSGQKNQPERGSTGPRMISREV